MRGKIAQRNSNGVRPLQKLPLNLAERVRKAISLHRGLNEAIVNGDSAWLKDNATGGLRDKLSRAFEERGSAKSSWFIKDPFLSTSEVPSWPLCTLLPTVVRSYRLESDMVAQMPISSDCLVRQSIVRINSVQTYTLPKNTTPHAPKGSKKPETKELEEYVVIQQVIFGGKEQRWRIWGTLNPTTMQKFIEDEKVNKDRQTATWMDNVRANMPGNLGASMPM